MEARLKQKLDVFKSLWLSKFYRRRRQRLSNLFRSSKRKRNTIYKVWTHFVPPCDVYRSCTYITAANKLKSNDACTTKFRHKRYYGKLFQICGWILGSFEVDASGYFLIYCGKHGWLVYHNVVCYKLVLLFLYIYCLASFQ